ncbi:MAG: MerR family transcriptional regulator [Sandaracinaceae bacterium]|nr:MerR family transcriptional regulator [Sandaracinaceae bacterium]
MRHRPQKPSDDPLADLYSTADVAKLFDLRESRLRSWAKSGFITPSATVGKKQLYTFQDLVSVRAAKALLERGVPQKRVKDSVDAIRRTLPKVTRPLAELRVTEEGGSVVMRDRLGAFVPTTGQQVIDFDVSAVRDDVVRVLRTGPTAEARRSAYEHYLEGCRLDEDEATFERAEAAYLAALRLDASPRKRAHEPRQPLLPARPRGGRAQALHQRPAHRWRAARGALQPGVPGAGRGGPNERGAVVRARAGFGPVVRGRALQLGHGVRGAGARAGCEAALGDVLGAGARGELGVDRGAVSGASG